MSKIQEVKVNLSKRLQRSIFPQAHPRQHFGQRCSRPPFRGWRTNQPPKGLRSAFEVAISADGCTGDEDGAHSLNIGHGPPHPDHNNGAGRWRHCCPHLGLTPRASVPVDARLGLKAEQAQHDNGVSARAKHGLAELVPSNRATCPNWRPRREVNGPHYRPWPADRRVLTRPSHTKEEDTEEAHRRREP